MQECRLMGRRELVGAPRTESPDHFGNGFLPVVLLGENNLDGLVGSVAPSGGPGRVSSGPVGRYAQN